jgi:hypothetical protein
MQKTKEKKGHACTKKEEDIWAEAIVTIHSCMSLNKQ